MRFRRKLKICKGLSLNFSGSGISLTMGVKGASITMGKRGVYTNYGIPGTGLYHRQKIAGGNTLSQQSVSYSSTTSNLYQHQIAAIELNVKLDKNNNPIVEDNYGNVITDENLLRTIRRTQEYKDAYQRLSQAVYNKITDKNASFIEIYKHTERPVRESTILKALEELQPETYEKKVFDKAEPTEDSIQRQLVDEAKDKIKSILFWTLKEKRKHYVLSKLQDRYNEVHKKWIEDKKAFDEYEEGFKTEFDELSRQECEEKRNELKNIINGIDTYVDYKIENIISQIELPVEFSIDYEYHPEEFSLYLDIDLPEIEDMPTEIAQTLKSGKVSVKTKTQKQTAIDYSTCVCGLAFFFSGMFFNVSTKIKQIRVSGYTQRMNKKTNSINDDYVFSVQFDRPTFSRLNYRTINPVEQISHFPHLLDITASNTMKTINLNDALLPPVNSI